MNFLLNMVEMMSFRTAETGENPDEQGRDRKKPCLRVLSVYEWELGVDKAEIRSACWNRPLGKKPRCPAGNRAQEYCTTLRAMSTMTIFKIMLYMLHTTLQTS